MPAPRVPPATHSATPSAAQRAVFRGAAAFTLLSFVMGSIVCATESGAACPTWPGCFSGQVGPGGDLNPIIEFVHRFSVIFTGPLLVAAGVMARRRPREERLVRLLPWVAVAGAIASGAFGRIIVVGHLPTWLGVVDLSCAFVAMLAIGTATLALERAPYRWSVNRTAQRAFAGTVTLIVMHLLGILAAGPGSYTRCVGWPIWRLVESDLGTGLQVTRWAAAIVGTALIAATAWAAWSDRSQARLRTHVMAVVALWVAEQVVGAAMGGQRLDPLLAATYSGIAGLLVWTLGMLGARACLGDSRPRGRGPEGSPSAPRATDLSSR